MCNIMEWEKPLHEHTCNYIQNWEVNNKKLVSTGKRRNSSPPHQCIQYSSMVFKPRLYRYINRIAFRLSWVSFIMRKLEYKDLVYFICVQWKQLLNMNKLWSIKPIWKGYFYHHYCTIHVLINYNKVLYNVNV